MAAVDSSESAKRQNSPTEEVETSGRNDESGKFGCISDQRTETTPRKAAPSTDDEQRDSVGSGGGCTASHSDVSTESGAAADRTTCHSEDDPKSAKKMSEAPCADRRAFAWSEAEDNGAEARTPPQENQKCDHNCKQRGDLQPEAHKVETAGADNHVEEILPPDEKNTGKELHQEQVEERDELEGIVEDDEEVDQEQDADMTKVQKCCLLCKDCGKTFSRRETFNLHRHSHAREDELAPLTSKDCGLTFQHRRSLIKHRNEHREEEEQLLTPKEEVETMEEGRFQCAACVRIFSTVGKLRDHSCSGTIEKLYHCPLCRQEFQFKVSITKHMMSHSQESVFACQECSQTFPNTIALRHHQSCHTALKPYKCPECGMVFKHYSVMEDHRRKHTDGSRSHLCTICGKTFNYSSLLHQHQYLHTGQKPFRCPECGKNFAFAQNMKAHCRQHKLRKLNSPAEQPSKQAPPAEEAVKGPMKENTPRIEERERTFTCPLCPKIFSGPAPLKVHMLIHEAEYEMLERASRAPPKSNKHWEKGHTCPHCPCVYRDESGLKSHLLSFHKSVAQYLEKAVAPLKKQRTLINGDNLQGKFKSDGVSIKPHKCSECGKVFRHRSVLELHMRIHSKEKPYQCKVCGKSFRFSSYLQQHLIIHSGKKPYKCPDCGKDFAFLQNMKTHQRLHQEKPFRCTSCRKGYSDESQLQHHMLSHNGDKPHKCDLCDKSFGLAYLLRDHMNTHTGERPHRCEECNKTFSWFSSLIVHQKIHTRKRQGFVQCNSLTMGTKMRGRSSRGKRGGRHIWGLSRPLGDSEVVGSQPSTHQASALRDAEMHRTVQPQSSVLSSRMDLPARQQKEQWSSNLHLRPVQWKVDGGQVMPAPSSQQVPAGQQQTHFTSPPHPGLQQQHPRNPGVADTASISQSGPTPVQNSDSSYVKENASSVVNSIQATLPKKSSPSVVSELEQPRQPKPVTWSSTPTLASTSSSRIDFSVPPYRDGAALWSVRPALPANSQGSPNKLSQELPLPTWPVITIATQKQPSTSIQKPDSKVWDSSNPQVIPSTVSLPEKPWNSCDLQKQWAPGLPGASTSAQIDQSSAMPISAPVSHGAGSTLWDIHTPPGIPKTLNTPEKLVNNQDFHFQQKQVSSGWTNVQSQTATQKVPVSVQYEPHRFGQGVGAAVWGFQNNAVAPQSLLTGQLKPGNGQELQQPILKGAKLIINQPSPFFSPSLAPLHPLGLPGPHPLHSVRVSALSRPSHPKIFFTPQGVISDRAQMPQTLPLPQLTPRTESLKLGPRLPFPSERLLQCMICRCSFPREVDLQMHYLQHAQGDI